MARTYVSVLALLLAAAPLAAAPELPAFDVTAFATPAVNSHYPLIPGQSRTFAGTEPGADTPTETAVITVIGPGPVILGVQTTTVLDEAFEVGRIVERTFDYFATDSAGNIWYFGEDVTNFRYDDAGLLTGTDSASAWRAGVNGAQPGISFPAMATLGLSLFQEHAPTEEAMDYFEIVATGLTVTTPAGTFRDVIQTYETSTAETDLHEFKFWAPDVGMIRADEDMTAERTDPQMVVELLR